MKYRKKPVVIEAVQFNGSSSSKARISDWIAGLRGCPDGDFIDTRDFAEFIIPTLEGEHIASPGDFIVKGIKSEFYPVKPDIFAATYEQVECEEVELPVNVTSGE